MSGFFTKTHDNYPDPLAPEVISFPGKILSVSYSGMLAFETCPYAVYLDKVKNISRLSGPAALRGSILHGLLEAYVKDKDKMVWTKLKSSTYHQSLIDIFKADYKKGLCIPELKFAFTKNMKKTKWDSRTMWVRGAIDIIVFETKQKKRAAIYDYKSGGTYASVKHRAQLLLYALMMFMLYPDLEYIKAVPIYIDHMLNLQEMI